MKFRYILYIILFIAVLTPLANGAGADTMASNAGTSVSEIEYILPVIQISGFSDQVVFVETFGAGINTPITGWTVDGTGQLSLDAQNAVAGNALKIQSQGQDLKIVSQPIVLAAYKPYRLGFYLKMEPGLNTQLCVVAADQVLPCDTYQAEAEAGWHYYETFFRTVSVNSVSIHLKVTSGKGNIWLDQIILYETEKIASVPFPPAPNYWQTNFEIPNVNLTLN